MILHPIIPLIIIGILGALLFALVVICILQSRGKVRLLWIRRGLLVAFSILLLLGISVPGGKSPAGMMNLDVIYMVDTTTSMAAEDYDGAYERLMGVRADMATLATKLNGARFGIIGFDKEAHLLLPMTTDQSSVASIISSFTRENSVYSKGSSIDMGLDMVLKQLKANKALHPDRAQLVFYFGDGEQTAETTPQSFAPLRPYVLGGAVLGYGTTKGGPMHQFYGYTSADLGAEQYVIDNSGSSINDKAISKIDESSLKKIANELNLPYIHRTNKSALDSLVTNSNAQKLADTTRLVTYYINLYFLFAIPIILLLAGELLTWKSTYRALKTVAPEQQQENTV